ncbi:hypothetical protein FHQ08_08685 [Lactobacillus sp. CC-MHH1034]|uniref:hypothetical protein n=1 Tax=Agrilactobacillus fermenti TaxID=2586909 RepID=UPI001E56E9A5|nr:hypothetical protein [Agrilactobacillus fermenti]MCD2256799.1 hypothetical protein [Agrilactobacillus fermenti]
MKFRKLTDERLIQKRLSNTRILFNLQTALIIFTIIIETINKGVSSLPNNPLVFIFTVTTVAMAFQEMFISRDVYKNTPIYQLGLGLLINLAIIGLILFTFNGLSALAYVLILVLTSIVTFAIAVGIFKARK